MWGRRQTLMSERVSLGRRALGYITGNSEYWMPGPGLLGIAVRRTGRWAARTAWRMVKRAARKYKALGPLLLGVAVWVAAALAYLAAGGWITLAEVGVCAAPVLWWWLGLPLGRGTRRRGLPPAKVRAWYTAAFVAYTGWAVAAAYAGPWPGLNPTPGLLLVIMAVFQCAWSWHRRVRHADVPPPIEMSEVEAMWQRIPGTAGTRLFDIREYDNPRRVEAKVDLIGTDLTVENLAKLIPHVAKHSGDLPQTNVILGYLPHRSEGTAMLKVVYENPCDAPIVYDKSWIPTAEEIAQGIVPLFLYPDGKRGHKRLYYPGRRAGVPGAGGVMSLYSGDIGSGKSAAMGAGLTQATMTGRVWPMAACPQGGASFPEWAGANGQAAWKAVGHDDDLTPILDQLEFLNEVMADRTDRLARFRWVDAWDEEQVGLPGWDYDIIARYAADNGTKPWPLIVMAFDEIWRAMSLPEYAAIVKALLKLGRKAGIILDAATQYPGLEEFNNDAAMRQPLAAGNLFAFRNKDGTTASMILSSELPAPDRIPAETPDGADTKGTMIAEAKGPRSSQPTYSRAVWVERAAHWAKKAAERIHPLEPEAEAILRRYLPAGQNWAPARPRTAPAATADTPAATTPATTGTPSGKHLDRIVAYLAGHDNDRATTGTIAAALGVPTARVSEALGRAVKAGDPRVVDYGHGLWGLSEAARPRELVGAAA